MKKIYLIALLITTPCMINAQISLDATMAPTIGSQFIYYDANTPVPAFTFSKTGTTNTWDFTAISPLPIQEDTVFIVDPSTIPGSSVFPTATHAIRENDDASYSMVNINPTSATFLGALGDVFGNGGNFATIVNPPIAAYIFPLTYGSYTGGTTNMELFATGVAVGQPTVDSIRYKSTITFTQNVLASGNIILPSGTFGALLNRETNLTIDSAWIKGAVTGNVWIPAPGFPEVSSDSAFYWYTTIALQKVAHALYDNTGLHDVVFLKSTTVGLNDPIEQISFNVFPNPVNNTLNLTPSKNQNSNYQFQIADVSGKIILVGKGNTQKIDVERLVPGIYVLMIKNEDGSFSDYKFIKD